MSHFCLMQSCQTTEYNNCRIFVTDQSEYDHKMCCAISVKQKNKIIESVSLHIRLSSLSLSLSLSVCVCVCVCVCLITTDWRTNSTLGRSFDSKTAWD